MHYSISDCLHVQVHCNKIKANTKNENNPEGVLTNSEQEYLDCFKFGYRELEVLFSQDDAFWSEKRRISI